MAKQVARCLVPFSLNGAWLKPGDKFDPAKLTKTEIASHVANRSIVLELTEDSAPVAGAENGKGPKKGDKA